jgi:hypothetical protein
VLKGGTVLHEQPLASYAFAWPESAKPLEAGDDYVLELSGTGGAEKRIEFEVEAKRGSSPLTIVRLD